MEGSGFSGRRRMAGPDGQGKGLEPDQAQSGPDATHLVRTNDRRNFMVEKTEHSAIWLSLYDPFRALTGRVADWLSPATEASGSGESYTINMELPGVG